MAEFFGPLSQMRNGTSPAQDVVHRAKEHCRNGHPVRNLKDLWEWMQEKIPETPEFSLKLAGGKHPEGLAAFVVASVWDEWKKHAVWALHGELYMRRLQFSRAALKPDQYQNNLAGALMHRANGFMHATKCAKAVGLTELPLPFWDEPRPLEVVARQAVADMRQSCSLRSEKYGKKSDDPKSSALLAYQAALRNLAEAIEVHTSITGKDPGPTGPAWLCEKAETLTLKDPKIEAASNAGEELSPTVARRVQQDLRLAETAACSIPCPTGGATKELCLACKRAKPTRIGFSCRCLCLCEECAKATGGRIQECRACGDWTEFIPSDQCA